jgi:hypothetical protein
MRKIIRFDKSYYLFRKHFEILIRTKTINILGQNVYFRSAEKTNMLNEIILCC